MCESSTTYYNMKTLQSLCSHVRLAGLLLFAALIIGCVSDKDKMILNECGVFLPLIIS